MAELERTRVTLQVRKSSEDVTESPTRPLCPTTAPPPHKWTFEYFVRWLSALHAWLRACNAWLSALHACTPASGPGQSVGVVQKFLCYAMLCDCYAIAM